MTGVQTCALPIFYIHGMPRFGHRNMSQQATLYEALLHSGQLFWTTAVISGNSDIGEVHAVLLDWNWPDTVLPDVNPPSPTRRVTCPGYTTING